MGDGDDVDDVAGLLSGYLADPYAGWSMGAPGAIAERDVSCLRSDTARSVTLT